MNEEIRLPDMSEIASWLNERCQVERTRLRNELAFIQGDRAQGGPSREDLAAELKFRLAAIDAHLRRLVQDQGRSDRCRHVSRKASGWNRGADIHEPSNGSRLS